MIYDNGTSIGINTTSPSAKLHISGSHTDALFRLYSEGGAGTTIYGPASVCMWASEPNVSYPGSGIGANINGSPYYGRIDSSNGQSYVRFGPSDLSFYTGTGDASIRVVIKNSGEVGINTTNPLYMLDVNGSIYGKGITADSDGGIGNAIYAYNQVLNGSTTNALIQLDTTWNTTGNAVGIEFNVTNTASGASSKLMNLKVDLASMFNVSKTGAITTNAPTGYTAGAWKLGTPSSGTISPDQYIVVEIDGNIYSLAAIAGTP